MPCHLPVVNRLIETRVRLRTIPDYFQIVGQSMDGFQRAGNSYQSFLLGELV